MSQMVGQQLFHRTINFLTHVLRCNYFATSAFIDDCTMYLLPYSNKLTKDQNFILLRDHLIDRS